MLEVRNSKASSLSLTTASLGYEHMLYCPMTEFEWLMISKNQEIQNVTEGKRRISSENRKPFFSNNKTEEYLLKNKMQLLANEIKTKVITK